MKLNLIVPLALLTATLISCASNSENSVAVTQDRSVLSSEPRSSLIADEKQDAAAILKTFFDYYKVRTRFDGQPKANGSKDAGILVLIGDGANVLRTIPLTASPKDRYTSQENIIANQVATFVELKNFRLNGSKSSLDFYIPSMARYGTTFFVKESSGRWVIDNQSVSRSSSGAKYYYGKLYAGVTCKDGTEMAFRWNFYQNSGQLPHGGACPAAEFPEVKIYKDIESSKSN